MIWEQIDIHATGRPFYGNIQIVNHKNGSNVYSPMLEHHGDIHHFANKESSIKWNRTINTLMVECP